MQYSKEIILSDLMTQGIPDSMIRHAENVNLDRERPYDPLKQVIFAKGSNLDNFDVVEPQDILNMARTSNLSGKGGNSSQGSSEQSQRNTNQVPINFRQPGISMIAAGINNKGAMDLQRILDNGENQVGGNSPIKQKLPPKPLI